MSRACSGIRSSSRSSTGYARAAGSGTGSSGLTPARRLVQPPSPSCRRSSGLPSSDSSPMPTARSWITWSQRSLRRLEPSQTRSAQSSSRHCRASWRATCGVHAANAADCGGRHVAFLGGSLRSRECGRPRRYRDRTSVDDVAARSPSAQPRSRASGGASGAGRRGRPGCCPGGAPGYRTSSIGRTAAPPGRHSGDAEPRCRRSSPLASLAAHGRSACIGCRNLRRGHIRAARRLGAARPRHRSRRTNAPRRAAPGPARCPQGLAQAPW